MPRRGSSALRMFAVSALVVSLAAALAAPAAATTTSTAALEMEALERLARELVDAGAPGVIVRVDDGGGLPVEIAEQARWARRDHVLRAGDEFRVGSSTKTVMATLVLQLVAEGELALADPVEKWLPGEVPGGKAITVRMLLNHTSGLADYTADPAVVPSIVGKGRRGWTSAELLAVGVKHDPLFAPGTKWDYSNTNYAAIGALLERVTGVSLADLVRDRIARPLNLAHTYYAADPAWRGRHVRGYEPDAEHMPPGVPAEFRDFAGPRRDGHVDVSGNDLSWGGAAGAVVSTAWDLARFHTALMSGKLLPAAQLAEMRTTVPVLPEQPDGPGYGLGIQTGTTPCGTFWGHDAGIPGYFSVNVTDRTGSRAATMLVAMETWVEFGSNPKIAAASKALQTAMLCTMLGRPVPRSSAGVEHVPE
ncbi:beta-lactamase family protein [Allokutzneria sp. A3M-2-11 16]|uniref:serine hydrolase domain-containing protein n=1 Tax=Allokutzneria sp. A3M-2-11 16 TaxID=2962043 RepID=UPI0020B7BC01|nr:serine hydrolase domain-containing protein [Allokutzneria sp. A3M-2-11 16]MCP3801368.1 beta-lactamase family protein [Allokutzneria sp. A3M-2-11 16]